MAKETQGIPFTDIHINLKERRISLTNDTETVATVVFKATVPPEGVIFLPGQSEASPASTPRSQTLSEADADIEELFRETSAKSDLAEAGEPLSPAPRPDAPKEKEKTVILSGKLKSQPKPGRNDRSGKPTAYADFAAHVEGEEDAHYYKATFHRHTRTIALALPTEAQITVSGYPHPRESAKSTDTFSVVNIVDYPGKPPPKPKPR